MKIRNKKVTGAITAGVFAASLFLPWTAAPAVAEASAASTVKKGAAGGLAALIILAKINDYRNAHYYEYAKPVGAIEKRFTPMGPYEVADWKADAEGEGAILAADPVMANNAPDDEVLAQCKGLGEALV